MMGDANQFNWVKDHRSLIRGPVLEIGSRHYTSDTAINYRSLCDGHDYIGVDMTDGVNVDVVLDFAMDTELVQERLGSRRFCTVICCSVLEHTENIFKMAKNISEVMETGGTLFISVPFTWRFHGYPDDYWRFTPKAVRLLFPNFSFHQELSTISSNVPGDVHPLVADLNPFIIQPTPALTAFQRLLEWLRTPYKRDRPYMLLPTMISMVGTKTVHPVKE